MEKGKKSDHRQRLNKLRVLVDSLHDRDEQLKRDLKMFDNFVESFPVPVTMWSINREQVVLSKRGTAFACINNNVSSLEDIFQCPSMRKDSIEKHAAALQGEVQSYFIQDDQHIYYTRLVPRPDEVGNILGVVGIAWDVSSNAIMISKLEDIVDLVDQGGDLSAIKKAAEDALSVSRLRNLLSEES
jgi:hypothetical protein